MNLFSPVLKVCDVPFGRRTRWSLRVVRLSSLNFAEGEVSPFGLGRCFLCLGIIGAAVACGGMVDTIDDTLAWFVVRQQMLLSGVIDIVQIVVRPLGISSYPPMGQRI
jgi:hypothetical protein